VAKTTVERDSRFQVVYGKTNAVDLLKQGVAQPSAPCHHHGQPAAVSHQASSYPPDGYGRATTLTVVVLKLVDRILLLLNRAPKNADDLAAEQEAKRVWDKHAFHKSTGELTAVPKTDPRNW
jgi:hypothetical protein